jgi:hypothetical protein
MTNHDSIVVEYVEASEATSRLLPKQAPVDWPVLSPRRRSCAANFSPTLLPVPPTLIKESRLQLLSLFSGQWIWWLRY